MARWEDVLHQQHLLWRGYVTSLAQPGHPEAYRKFAQHLRHTLLDADPIYLDGDVQTLIEAAVPSFELEPVHASDFFTQSGFLLLARPLGNPTLFMGEPAPPLGAFAWTPYGHGQRLSLFAVDGRRVVPGLMLTGARSPIDLVYGATPDAVEPEVCRYFQVLLRFAQQRIASRTQQRLPRGLRRDLTRRGDDRSAITVVRLRRPRARRGDEKPSADCQFRHLVRAHWKNQWYPSLGPVEDPAAHRQIPIADYIRGDEDKPLRLTQRAFEVVR